MMSCQEQYHSNNSPIGNNSYSLQQQQQKPGYTSKKCNCKQSQCIKLYCECYAAGVYCNGCHCVSCKNNDQSEGWRNQAIQNTLVKNPTAFLPKISQKAEATSKVVDPLNLGKHNKGCACKRSGCMKKYCECFQAGVPCSENCKCTDCQNTGFVSHGNLLRQFREDDSYNSQNQILHKLLLAHNEEHLNSILNEQNGGNDFGNYKRGIPIKNEFIEESCMKLLQILHLPDDDIYKRRDQLLTDKSNLNHILNAAAKEQHLLDTPSNQFSKHQNITEQQQKKEDRILKTPPQKSKRPDGTAGEGDRTQKSGENYNKDTSYDIDMACQDENMDEEDEQVDVKVNNFERTIIEKMDAPQHKNAVQQNKDSEIQLMHKEIIESNQTESTAATTTTTTTTISAENKVQTSTQKSATEDLKKSKNEESDQSNKEGDNIQCEEDANLTESEKVKGKEKKEENENENKNEEEVQEEKIIEEEEQEQNIMKEEDNKAQNGTNNSSQGSLHHQQHGNNGNEMDIEYHSSALKKKQELYEIRRLFILDKFIELLRNVEQTI